MNIHQISVFLENRAGQLSELTNLLAAANIDIRAISIAETTDYGLVRMIVDDSKKASDTLLGHGNVLSMTPVMAVEVPDRPAGLAELLKVFEEYSINIEYMYSLFTHREGLAYMVIKVNDEQAVLDVAAKGLIKLADAAFLGLK
ncbi:MAG: ACT domain-containing protein [Oscillospiraceae bacterium]|nr:ACT domain-containing protein [Oscillospiraceae bacterium]